MSQEHNLIFGVKFNMFRTIIKLHILLFLCFSHICYAEEIVSYLVVTKYIYDSDSESNIPEFIKNEKNVIGFSTISRNSEYCVIKVIFDKKDYEEIMGNITLTPKMYFSEYVIDIRNFIAQQKIKLDVTDEKINKAKILSY